MKNDKRTKRLVNGKKGERKQERDEIGRYEKVEGNDRVGKWNG